MHIVVVLVPLSALALVVCAIWPHLARRLGVLPPVLALVALVSVPLTTQAGESLEDGASTAASLVERHAQLGDGLLPWALGLFVLSSALWWAARRTAPARETPRVRRSV